MADTIRLVLADDHQLFRDLMRQALANHPRLQIIGEAQDTEAAIRCAQELRPDIVVMDLNMPGGGGVTATQTLRASLPDTEIIIVTGSDDDEDLIAALRPALRGTCSKPPDWPTSSSRSKPSPRARRPSLLASPPNSSRSLHGPTTRLPLLAPPALAGS